MSRPQRLLIYRVGELGDTVVALPALWALRRHYPQAELTFLGSQLSSGHIAARSVLPASGLIDQWMSYPAGPSRTMRSMLSLWRALRSRRFESLVYLAPRWRFEERVDRDLRFFRLAGIKRVIGHEGVVPLPPKSPDEQLARLEQEADHLLHRLRVGGIATPPDGQGEMELAINSEEQRVADEWLLSRLPGSIEESKLVGLGPGSKWQSKIWPYDRFIEVGRRLIGEFGVIPIVLGGTGDRLVAQQCVGQWGRGIAAAGELTVRQSAAVLRRCRLYIGNDTGTMHLAAAVGTPCVGIFSALDWPGRWYPYGTGHIVLRRSVPCEGCMASRCPVGHLLCLSAISVDEVVAACQIKLGMVPQG